MAKKFPLCQPRKYMILGGIILIMLWCIYWLASSTNKSCVINGQLKDCGSTEEIAKLLKSEGDNKVQYNKHKPYSEREESNDKDTKAASVKHNTVKHSESIEEDVLDEESSYIVIHGDAATLVHPLVHRHILYFDEDVDHNHYTFSSKKLPKDVRHRPSIGNGNLATIVHSKQLFMNGIYSGYHNNTHRAVIPSTVSVHFTGTEPHTNYTTSYTLNAAHGVFSQTHTSKHYKLTERIYAHRNITQLMVVEFDLEQSTITPGLKLNMDLNKWYGSFDLTFQQYDSFMDEVSYKVGSGNAAELDGMDEAKVHVYYDHIPDQLTPTATKQRTKWIFISSFATTKDEALQAYKLGVSLVHDSDRLYTQHVESWHSLWRAGRVDIAGNSQLAKAVYGSWYYLLSSIPLQNSISNPYIGLSPSGLPLGELGKDYQGHVFWDQETWMFPPILWFHTELVDILLQTRNRTADRAHQNALQHHHRGLRYPWESAYTGAEVCPWPPGSEREIHISADISLALRQYIYANRNNLTAALRYKHIIYGIADYYISRATYNDKRQLYDILDVMPPDEHIDHVNNSAYTNAAAQLAISLAQYVATNSGQQSETHAEYSRQLYVPYDDNKRYHPEYEGFTYEQGKLPHGDKFVKQADAILLGYPLLRDMPGEVRRNDLIIYEKITDPAGPAMSWGMFAIGYLELKEFTKAEEHFVKNYYNIRNEFQVWTEESSGRGAANFITGAGGFLQAVVAGYAGLRLREDRLDLDPVLPPQGTTGMRLVGVDYLSASFDMYLRDDSTMIITVTSSSTTQLRLYVYSTAAVYNLIAHQSLTLDAERVCIQSTNDPVPKPLDQ